MKDHTITMPTSRQDVVALGAHDLLLPHADAANKVHMVFIGSQTRILASRGEVEDADDDAKRQFKHVFSRKMEFRADEVIKWLRFLQKYNPL
jgi:hypothetical protein